MFRLVERGSLRRPLTAAAASFLLGLFLAPPASAFDAKTGETLATRWCSKCHLVGPGGMASDAAPTFADIANDPERTPDRLRTWMADPHPPMPNLSLSRDEIEAILAYLDTLKEN